MRTIFPASIPQVSILLAVFGFANLRKVVARSAGIITCRNPEDIGESSRLGFVLLSNCGVGEHGFPFAWNDNNLYQYC